MRHLKTCLTLTGVIVLLLVLSLWFIFFRNSKPTFDAKQLAHSETMMWKAYYARDPLELNGQLNLMLHNQFGLSRYRTWQASSRLTLASLDFASSPRPISDATREKLVQDIAKAYRGIKVATGLDFDSRKAAEAELAWWVARRTPGQNSVEQVGKKIEALYKILYGKTNDHIAQAGQLRAEAARVRDENSDWPEVERLLVQSYGELVKGVGQ